MKNSLKYKLLALLVVVSIIPALLIGIAAYALTNRVLLQSSISSIEQMNRHKADAFDLFASELSATIKDLTDSEATRAFLQLRDEPESESYYLSVLRLSEKLDTLITQRGEAVDAVAFLWNDGSLPMIRNYGSALPLNGDYRTRAPFREMMQSDAATHWIILEDHQEPRLYLYKTIYNTLSKENLGLALIRIDSSYIRSILLTDSDAADATCLTYGDGCTCFVVGDLQQAEALFQDQTIPNESVTVRSAKETYYLSSACSALTDFRIANLTSLKDISDNVTQLLTSVLCAIAVVIVIAGICALLLFQYLQKPIVGVHTAMRQFQCGALNTRVEVRRKDELGQLGEGFNEMAEQITQLIADMEQEQKKKKEIAIRFLQAQINPHFLYNTLNSIKVLTRMNRNEESCQMTTALISLLRLASGASDTVTLAQESEYIQSYISLMCLRRDLQVTFDLELRPELLPCQILKFSLQPFVENSILHGASDGKIGISVSAKELAGGTLEIRIQDDGIGFDTGNVPEAQKTPQRFHSIGIHNVSERIKMYYGDHYGVDIQSCPGKGTLVILTLPLIKSDEQEKIQCKT